MSKRLSVPELAILLYGRADADISEQFIQFARNIEDAHHIGTEQPVSDEEIKERIKNGE